MNIIIEIKESASLMSIAELGKFLDVLENMFPDVIEEYHKEG